MARGGYCHKNLQWSAAERHTRRKIWDVHSTRRRAEKPTTKVKVQRCPWYRSLKMSKTQSQVTQQRWRKLTICSSDKMWYHVKLNHIQSNHNMLKLHRENRTTKYWQRLQAKRKNKGITASIKSDEEKYNGRPSIYSKLKGVWYLFNKGS